ncbi:MAG: DinB-like domain protein [Gemmatimonadetes bacterium]|nr:DinB-like domain protein [Gemmatimonadota bacterium]
MHPRLAELTEYLAQQRRAVLAAAAAVPSALWTEQPAPDRWSLSQILEHLHRVERGVAALVAKRIASAAAAGHPAETETSSVLGTLGRFGVSDRATRLVSPAIVDPTESPDRETVERRLAESRAVLLAAIESGDGLALGAIRHTHNRFGELDLYEWILFVGEHEKRHALQLEEVAAQLAPAS